MCKSAYNATMFILLLANMGCIIELLTQIGKW